MRTARDFDELYLQADPWRISGAWYRDKVLRRCIGPFVVGKSVLELGCGEGHLTQAVFDKARSVTGVDISDLAITRAKALNLPNATFESGDFLGTSFEGNDVITALECVYYLSAAEQDEFFVKVAREHPRKLLIISGPIIGETRYRRYFTHAEMAETFRRYGFSMLRYCDLSVQPTGVLRTAVAVLLRLPFCLWLMDWLPEALVYQRAYIVRAP